jgi:hypothetical protein
LSYLKALITHQQKASSIFQRESTNGGDADVRRWAAEAFPTLETQRGRSLALVDEVKPSGP